MAEAPEGLSFYTYLILIKFLCAHLAAVLNSILCWMAGYLHTYMSTYLAAII